MKHHIIKLVKHTPFAILYILLAYVILSCGTPDWVHAEDLAERFRQVEENDRAQDTKIEDLQIGQAHLRAELKEQRMSDIAVAIIIYQVTLSQ